MGILAGHVYELARLVGAIREEGIVTAGTTTTLTDAIGLAGFDDDALNGVFLYIWSGTAMGQERRVTDHAGATGVLTFPTGTAPSTDSKYVIFNSHWRAADFKTAIQLALRERRKFYLLPKVDESLAFVADQYDYPIPAGFAAIERIVVERTDGQGDFIDPVPPDCWGIHRGAVKEIVFEKAANDMFGFMKTGHAIRIVGQKYEDEPTSDSSVLTIPTGALLQLAASYAHHMARPKDANNSGSHGQLASIAQQTWLSMRGDDESHITPMSRWVNEV